MVDIDPGEFSHRIGSGRTAEIFRLRDGRIIKLLAASVPQTRAERELRFAQQAEAAGLPVWPVRDLVRCGDRWGLIGQRLPSGTTSLARRLMQRPWEVNRWFSAFVALHRQINSTSAENFPPIRKRLARRIRSSNLPKEAIAAALKRLRKLPDGNGLCHGDLHPANILIADGRLLAIDWASAGRGPRALDAARTIFLLSFGSAPGLASRLVRPIGQHYAGRYQAQRLEEEEITAPLLEAWRLPIMAARLVRRHDEERAFITELLQAELTPQDTLASSEQRAEPSPRPKARRIPSQSRKEASRP